MTVTAAQRELSHLGKYCQRCGELKPESGGPITHLINCPLCVALLNTAHEPYREKPDARDDA